MEEMKPPSGYQTGSMNKKVLSETDICSKFITPAVTSAGWDEMAQVRREVFFTKGRIIVRGKLVPVARPRGAFLAPAQLWASHRVWKGVAPEQEAVILQNYQENAGGEEPRDYQQIAIN